MMYTRGANVDHRKLNEDAAADLKDVFICQIISDPLVAVRT
jgi:hypothetical protein